MLVGIATVVAFMALGVRIFTRASRTIEVRFPSPQAPR
jgi:hypothetical protein